MSAGRAMIEELPRVTETGWSSTKYCRSASCSTGSASRIRFTNGLAEPSMIGGSLAFISTSTLSMPQPCRALSTCSTVEIFAWPDWIVVARTRSVIRSTRGRISGWPATSIRLKTMPWPAGAGFIVSVTGSPVWSALPLSETSRRMVRCFMGLAQCPKADQKGKPGDIRRPALDTPRSRFLTPSSLSQTKPANRTLPCRPPMTFAKAR